MDEQQRMPPPPPIPPPPAQPTSWPRPAVHRFPRAVRVTGVVVLALVDAWLAILTLLSAVLALAVFVDDSASDAGIAIVIAPVSGALLACGVWALIRLVRSFDDGQATR